MAYALRGRIQTKQNWETMKLSQILSNPSLALQYREEPAYINLNPSKSTPAEIPFLKRKEPKPKSSKTDFEETITSLKKLSTKPSNPDSTSATAQTTGTAGMAGFLKNTADEKRESEEGAGGTNKERFLADMRARDEEKKPKEKYDRVMGWGTPRLVASNRMKGKGMTTVQLQGLTTLNRLAGERKGQAGNKDNDRIGGFQKTSIAHFTKNVMEADSEIAHIVKQPSGGEAPAFAVQLSKGMSMHSKMSVLSNEELKARARLNQFK